MRGVSDFVATGGSYLGICMGAYLAGSEGFGFFSESVGGGGGGRSRLPCER
ncbi:BPL-N domain-containing protein [Kocuria sp. SL71]|uniref:BPL-N domain-containing protein n=1 Tax=Kocuria sp. SL71 TaxID=2995151 RepID=UPI003FA3888D